MITYDNWGHVYGIVFNEIKYKAFIDALIDSQKKKEIFALGNKEGEVLFISSFKENDDGYAFLIGRTNEEVSKTKFDAKTFKSEDLKLKEHEHISDYTHIFISKKTISSTGNSFYLLLEKNQRLQIGSIKTLISQIIGYSSMHDIKKSKIYVGSIVHSDYIKKLLEHEILGKEIIINEVKNNILDLPDSENEATETTLTQISKYKKSVHFLSALTYLLENPKSHEKRDIFLVVDDGKNSHKKISFHSSDIKYVPFFQLPYYVKPLNKKINDNIIDKFSYVIKHNEYETI